MYQKAKWLLLFAWCTALLQPGLLLKEIPDALKDSYELLKSNTNLTPRKRWQYLQHVCWQKIKLYQAGLPPTDFTRKVNAKNTQWLYLKELALTVAKPGCQVFLSRTPFIKLTAVEEYHSDLPFSQLLDEIIIYILRKTIYGMTSSMTYDQALDTRCLLQSILAQRKVDICSLIDGFAEKFSNARLSISSMYIDDVLDFLVQFYASAQGKIPSDNIAFLSVLEQ